MHQIYYEILIKLFENKFKFFFVNNLKYIKSNIYTLHYIQAVDIIDFYLSDLKIYLLESYSITSDDGKLLFIIFECCNIFNLKITIKLRLLAGMMIKPPAFHKPNKLNFCGMPRSSFTMHKQHSKI